MHSDGLTQRWTPKTLPALLRHSPTVIAGHLLRSAGKYHDDASVAVAKGSGDRAKRRPRRRRPART